MPAHQGIREHTAPYGTHNLDGKCGKMPQRPSARRFASNPVLLNVAIGRHWTRYCKTGWQDIIVALMHIIVILILEVTLMGWPFRSTADGNVEQLKRGEWVILRGTLDSAGYRVASWSVPGGGRRFMRVHSIVWRVFNGPIPDGYEIDHIDMDKSNNNVANLRLVTHHENMLSARAKLGNWSEAIRKLKPWQYDLLLALPAGWECLKPLSDRWHVNKFSLSNIRSQAKRCGDARYMACL